MGGFVWAKDLPRRHYFLFLCVARDGFAKKQGSVGMYMKTASIPSDKSRGGSPEGYAFCFAA
ncbi:MAG: hypothetical protein FWF95_03510 [Syntrophorhabdaceae bacterium]|nr:hypothetical protein [Syntrophorhabdaceae bacterium]